MKVKMFYVALALALVLSVAAVMVPISPSTGTVIASSTTLSVSATSAWACDSGVDIITGQTLNITATGSWTSGTWTGDANGDITAPNPGGDFILPDENAYSLIGKIGATGMPFFIGTAYIGQATTSGRLYLGMNDTPGIFWDNSGILSVVVNINAPDCTVYDNFNDGDFTTNPAWYIDSYQGCAPHLGTVEVENGELHVRQWDAGGCGQGTGIRTDLDIPIANNRATITFDVKTIYASLSGSGYGGWEYPAQVVIHIRDANGEDKILLLGYNYWGTSVVQGPTPGAEYVYVVGRCDAPQDTWLIDESFVIQDYWPTAAYITYIWVGGGGWDYESRFDNVCLTLSDTCVNAEEFTADANTVALWHFNEGEGTTVTDSSTYGNDGTIYGATWVTEGLGCSALNFSTGAYIEVPDNPSLDGMEELTIEAWVNLRSYPNDASPIATIVAKWGPGYREDDSYLFYILDTGQLGLAVTGGPIPSALHASNMISTDVVPLDEWILLKATWERAQDPQLAEIHLYIGGVGTVGIPASGDGFMTEFVQDTAQPVWIGREPIGDTWFDGIIDEVRISNIARGEEPTPTPTPTLTPTPTTPATTINSNWTSVIPTVDGTLSSGEWDDAHQGSYTFSYGIGNCSDIVITVYAMNDANNLYMAFEVPDATYNTTSGGGEDQLNLFFDGDNDGSVDSGDYKEDAKWSWTSTGLTFRDYHYPWAQDTTSNGQAAYTPPGSQYVWEFSVPLSSGDTQDMSVSPGDTVGLCIGSVDASPDPNCYYYWPEGSTTGTPDLWGDLVLASEPGEGGCFIATAAYGTSTAEEIDTLRDFRDEVLLESAVGSHLVEWYYQTSPPVADFISENSLLKAIVREVLVDPIASFVRATEAIWGD